MVLLLAGFMTVTGIFITYVAIGLVRSNERKRGEAECDERLDLQRRDLLRRRR